MSAQVYGIDTTFMKTKNVTIASGRDISQQDIDSLSKVAVLGQDVVKELFDGQNPV